MKSLVMVNEVRGKSSRVSFGRKDFRGQRKPKRLGVVRKVMRYIPEDMPDFPTILNVPLHPDSGQPITSKMDVQQRQKLRKGFHIYRIVLLMTERGELIQREIMH